VAAHLADQNELAALKCKAATFYKRFQLRVPFVVLADFAFFILQ